MYSSVPYFPTPISTIYQLMYANATFGVQFNILLIHLEDRQANNKTTMSFHWSMARQKETTLKNPTTI